MKVVIFKHTMAILILIDSDAMFQTNNQFNLLQTQWHSNYNPQRSLQNYVHMHVEKLRKE